MTYDRKAISNELQKTAMGTHYYGNALYVALDFPDLSSLQKRAIKRWLKGTNTVADGFALQHIAIDILDTEKEWDK